MVLVQSNYTREHREATQALLKGFVGDIVEGVASSRSLPVDEVSAHRVTVQPQNKHAVGGDAAGMVLAALSASLSHTMQYPEELLLTARKAAAARMHACRCGAPLMRLPSQPRKRLSAAF